MHNGRGKGIVVQTGMNTEVGKIAGMLDNTEKQITPLQEKLNKLGKTLGIAKISNMCIYIYNRINTRKRTNQYVYDSGFTSSSTIPEGLVAVSTIVLAIGVQKW